MKHIKVYEDFVNEATTSWKKMMQGVRSSETGPWSIVAIQDRKVVGQSIDIRIQDLIPAKYEALKKEFPKAKLHIEDGTGMVVWNESLDVNESFINEDSSMAFLILMQAAIVNGLLIGQMASGGGGSFHPIDDLKDWWKKRKSDKAVKSIIDKIKDDKDVVEFMKLTPSQQRGKFRSLIATKLNNEELEYLSKINKSHFQTESVITEAEAPLYKDWNEFTNPDYIMVHLKDGRKLQINKRNVAGGQRVYQAILQAFTDERTDITNKVVAAMASMLGGTLKN